MELHHSKHHNTYVTNFNAATEKLATAVADDDVIGIVAGSSCHQIQRRRPPEPLHLLAEPRSAEGRRRRAADRCTSAASMPTSAALTR